MKAILIDIKEMPRHHYKIILMKVLETHKFVKIFVGARFGNVDRWRTLLSSPRNTIISGFSLYNSKTIDAYSEYQIERSGNEINR